MKGATAKARAKAAPILYSAGLSPEEIASAFKITAGRVYALLGGIVPRRDEMREQDMEARYRAGETLEEISRSYDLSRERVRQILSRRGVGREARQVVVKEKARLTAAFKAAQRKAKWDAHTALFYGCSLDEAMVVNGGRHLTDSSSPTKVYTRQKTTAGYRGIEWQLTLPQWWQVWQDSGKWEQRGRGKGKYCMSRFGDIGPYAVDNVRIITIESNASESYDTKPAAMRRGWTRDELGLTPRQRVAHDLFLLGLSPRDIAEQMGIKPQTARVMVCDIKRRTGFYEQKYGTA